MFVVFVVVADGLLKNEFLHLWKCFEQWCEWKKFL